MFKEIRKIDVSNLRNYCIRNNYYTNGTETEYNNLFKSIRENEENADLKMVELIAKNIYNHSNMESIKYKYSCNDNECIANMIYDIIKDCTYFYIDIK